jgi:hypothetical protein
MDDFEFVPRREVGLGEFGAAEDAAIALDGDERLLSLRDDPMYTRSRHSTQGPHRYPRV